MVLPNVPVVNAGTKYVNGLNLFYQGGVNALLLISPGASRDLANVNDIILPLQTTLVNGQQVPVTLNGQPVGAVINGEVIGANGVDIAPIPANVHSFYAVYVIGDSTSNKPTAGLLSLNEQFPLLPAGYDMFRRIGYCYSSGVSTTPVIQQWFQYGAGEERVYTYDSPISSQSFSGSVNYNLVPITSAPALADQIYLDVDYTSTTPQGVVNFLPYGSVQATLNPASAPGSFRLSSSVANSPAISNLTVPAETNNNISPPFISLYYRTTNASDTLVISTSGFVDFLG